MSSENTSLYLVDGSSLAFRSFFALITSGLRRSDGTPMWAIIGFYNALFELIEKRNPHRLAIAFDLPEPTFRHEEFADYKANRAEMPDDLAVQWPLIKEGIAVLGIPNYELAGYEADDVIGTIAKDAESKGMKVVIFSGDKDIFQLLDGKIEVLMPTTNEGVKTFDRQEVFNKLGVYPEQVIDYKGLVGDNSDNIPGVRGIGPKTAAQLLTDYKTMDGIYANLENIKSASVRNKLTEGKEIAYASKRLATIVLDVPVKFDYEHCLLKTPDIAAVVDYFRRVEANAILKRLPRILKYFNDGKEPEIDPELLEPVGKPKSAARPSMKRESLTAVADNRSVAVPADGSGDAASSVGAGRADAGRGGVLVAEQKKLELTVASRVAKVAVSSSAVEPELVRDTAALDKLHAELASQKLIAVEVLHDPAAAQPVCGIAFAWSALGSLNDLLRPQMPLKDNPVKTAYVPLAHQGSEQQLPAAQVFGKLRGLLENDKIGKVSYNGKHVMNALSADGINYHPLVFDPLLASYVIDPDAVHKLREQCQRLLGYTLASETDLLGTGKKVVTWGSLPLLPASQFAADTARLSLMLCGVYGQLLDGDQQELLFDMDLPLSEALASMEQAGLKIDTDYFGKLDAELKTEIAKLEQEIYRLAGHPFNIGSPIQLQTVLFKELQLPTKSKTKTGYSTDASVLEELSEEHEIAKQVLTWRHLTKLLSTYVEALPRQISPVDGRLHGEFNQASTATGRLSSTNPNLQNIPIRTEIGQRIRRGFVATDSKHKLIAADYSQIELRLLAHMSGDEKLIEAFANDQDIHARTAADIFGVPIENVSADQRAVGKTLNFALVYQQGAMATAHSIGTSTREAQEFINKYFAAYPKVRAFQAQVLSEARATGYVQTLWGRRRYFKNLNDRNDAVRKADERAAFNAPLQGSAADLIKRAMIRLEKELRAASLKTKLILQVHDELVLDAPATEVEQATKILVAAMTADEVALKVPLKVDVGVGDNWMDAK